MDVGGICDRDLQGVTVELVREGAQPLEHVQRDRAGGIVGDAGRMDVDQRQVVTRRECLRDHHAVGEPLVDESLGEGGGARLVPDEGKPVGRQEAGRLDDVGDELCQRIHLKGRLKRLRSLSCRAALVFRH